jgi:hypothetical protein
MITPYIGSRSKNPTFSKEATMNVLKAAIVGLGLISGQHHGPR